MVCPVLDDSMTAEAKLCKAQQEYTRSFLTLVDGGLQSLSTAPSALQRHQARKAGLRRKAENALLAFTVLVAFVFVGAAGYRVLEPSNNEPAHMSLVTVAPGENLWSLAKAYGTPGYSTADIVAAIKDANPGLENNSLAVGQRLLVPTNAVDPNSAMMAKASVDQNAR